MNYLILRDMCVFLNIIYLESQILEKRVRKYVLNFHVTALISDTCAFQYINNILIT